MQIVPDYAGVVEVVPMEAHLAPERLGCRYYMDDIPVHTHHHRLRAECIDTGCLPSPVENLERLSYWEFEPDILVAVQLHRNLKAVHLWARLADLFYPTRTTDTEADVPHPLHSVNFADWIVIPFQILVGSCFAPRVRYIVSLGNYVLNIPELHNTSTCQPLTSTPHACHPERSVASSPLD